MPYQPNDPSMSMYGGGDPAQGMPTVTVQSGDPNNLNFPVPSAGDIQDPFTGGISDPFAGGTGSFQTPDLSGSNISMPNLGLGGGGDPAQGGIGSSILGGLGSNLGGLLGGSNVLQLGAIGGLGALGLSQANSAQQQAQQQAQQLQGPAQQYLSASGSLLNQFASKTLSPAQNQYIGDMNSLASSIQDQNSNLSQIVSTNFGDYASGTLKPGDQAALDQQTAAAKTAMRQQMASAGIADSSVLQAYDQQIDTQAQIQKQQTLNGYFTTGDQAYNSWLNGTAEGAALKTTAANYAQTAFQNMMQDALGLGSLGMSGMSQSIALQVQSDEALGNQVSQLMQNLMSAFAYSVAGGGRGGGLGGMGVGGGGGAGGPSLLQQVTGYGNLANNIGNDLANLGGAGGGAADFSNLGNAADQAVNDAMSGAQGVTDLSDLGGSFPSAGGQAAGIGAGQILGAGLGALGAGYGAYKTWNAMQAGNTAGAAISGFGTGAAIGSIIPGVGTLLGGLGGAAVGALGSLFANKKDPEVRTFDSIINIPDKTQGAMAALQAPDKYQVLAGLFDEKDIHTNIPIYALYGRAGEQRFTQDMTAQIDNAYKAGKIPPNANAFSVFQTVVQPWINQMSMQKGINPVMQDPNAGIINATMIGMINDYMTGNTSSWKAAGGDNPFTNLPGYGSGGGTSGGGGQSGAPVMRNARSGFQSSMRA